MCEQINLLHMRHISTYISYVINTTVTVVYILANYIYSIICHGTSLKKASWPRGDSNLRRSMYDGREHSMSVD